MKIGNGAFAKRRDETAAESREDMRELAEAIANYRSAMRHVAEREPARPWNAAEARPKARRTRLLLLPVLAAGLAAAVVIPSYSHFHQQQVPAAHAVAREKATTNAETRASVDDTALMDQIDSDVSEEVPDALQPLAALSEQTTGDNSNDSVSENRKYVTKN